MNDVLKLKDVAELFQVAAVTIRLWTEKGMLEADRTPGGHRRYKREEVLRFAKAHNISIVPANNRLRILIVDDDPRWLTLTSDMLQRADPSIQLETAQSGFIAGQKLISFQPDIVLLDIRMPGISGLEVCREIKSSPANQASRVIAITGYASESEEQQLIQAGAECCLQKPIDFAQLFALIGLADSVDRSTKTADSPLTSPL